MSRRTDPAAAAKILERLKSDVTVKAGGAKTSEERFQTQCRDHLRKDLANRAEVLGSPTKVFISYSLKAQGFYDRAQAFFERQRPNDDPDKTFKTMNWHGPRDGLVGIGKALPQQIAACSCFLGIWVEPSGARTTKAARNSGETGLAPSPWMPYELGVARGSGAICRLLIHDDIDKKFISEPNVGDFNDRFNDKNFEARLQAVEESFLLALKERHPRWVWDSPLDQNYFEGSTAKYWPGGS